MQAHALGLAACLWKGRWPRLAGLQQQPQWRMALFSGPALGQGASGCDGPIGAPMSNVEHLEHAGIRRQRFGGRAPRVL